MKIAERYHPLVWAAPATVTQAEAYTHTLFCTTGFPQKTSRNNTKNLKILRLLMKFYAV